MVGMENGRALLAFAALALVAAYLLSGFSGVLNVNFFRIDKPDEIYLAERGAESFVLEFNFAGVCEVCGEKRELGVGENKLGYGNCGDRVDIFCGKKNVSLDFAVPKMAGVEGAGVCAAVDGKEVNITLSGKAKDAGGETGAVGRDLQVEYFIDGKLERAVFEKNVSGVFLFSEKFGAGGGVHEYRVEVNGEGAGSGGFEIEKRIPVYWVILLVCALLISDLIGKNWVEKFFAVFCMSSIFFVFHLQFISLFGAWFFMPVFAASMAALLVSGKIRLHFELPKVDARALVLFAGFGLALVMFSNFFIGSLDLWGPYYYRHAQNVFEKGTVFYQDDLSYLGRGFTYPPAYFEFAAGVGKVLFADSFEGVRLLQHFFVAFSYFASVYLLFFRYPGKQRLLASLLLISEIFIITTASNVTLHIFAYALMNIAVVLFFEENHWIFGLFALGTGIAAHPSAAFVFPVYVLAANRFEFDFWMVARGAVFLGTACGIALLFYVPAFYQYGLPNEIVPNKWGYLLTWGFGGVVNDFGAPMVVGMACAIAVILVWLQGNIKMPGRIAGFVSRLRGFWVVFVSELRGFLQFEKKSSGLFFAACLLVLLFLINVYVSFRANILFGIVMAGIVPMALGKFLKKDFVFAALCAFALFNLLVLFPLFQAGPKEWCAWGVANENCIAPMRFISAQTSGNSVIALNPLFGHLQNYLGGRASLADLYVEYADEGKYLAEMRAYERGEMPEGYPVDYLMLDKLGGAEEAAGMDKIYDNGFSSIWEK